MTLWAADNPALWVAAAGAMGTGLGIGLVVGAFVVRMLRRYMRSELHVSEDDQD